MEFFCVKVTENLRVYYGIANEQRLKRENALYETMGNPLGRIG